MTNAANAILIQKPGDLVAMGLLRYLKTVGAGQALTGGADAWFFNYEGHWVDGTYKSWKVRKIDGDDVIEVLFEDCSGYGLVPFGEEYSERDEETNLPVGLTCLERVSVKITLTAYSKNFLEDMKEGERYFYCITGVGEKKEKRKEAPWIVQCFPIAANAPKPTFRSPNATEPDPVTGEMREALPPANATTGSVRSAGMPRKDEMPGEHVEEAPNRGRARGKAGAVRGRAAGSPASAPVSDQTFEEAGF